MPLENFLIGQVTNMDAPEYMEQAAGVAHTATAAQFGQAQEQLEQNLAQHGLNPASGAYRSRTLGLNSNQAYAGGLNQASSGLAQERERLAGIQGLTQLGRGQSADAFKQLGQRATAAQKQAAFDANAALQEELAQQRLVGTGLGAATAIGFDYFTGPSNAAGLQGAGSQGAGSAYPMRGQSNWRG